MWRANGFGTETAKVAVSLVIGKNDDKIRLAGRLNVRTEEQEEDKEMFHSFWQ